MEKIHACASVNQAKMHNSSSGLGDLPSKFQASTTVDTVSTCASLNLTSDLKLISILAPTA